MCYKTYLKKKSNVCVNKMLWKFIRNNITGAVMLINCMLTTYDITKIIIIKAQ